MKKLVIILLFGLISCKSSKKVIQTASTNTKVVQKHTVSYKDTVFHVPKVSTKLRLSLQQIAAIQNQMDTALIKTPVVFTNNTGRAKVNLEIYKDSLVAITECDSLALVAKIKAELRQEYSSSDNKQDSETNIKRGYSFFDLISYCFVVLTVGFVTGYLVKTFKK